VIGSWKCRVINNENETVGFENCLNKEDIKKSIYSNGISEGSTKTFRTAISIDVTHAASTVLNGYRKMFVIRWVFESSVVATVEMAERAESWVPGLQKPGRTQRGRWAG
ncbi:unnamed protein product, partial [Ixodes persulcatus]